MSQAFKNLLGEKLNGPKGLVDVESIIREGKVVGLYFSAHWCPPCRGFTPKLADFYQKFRSSNGNKLEIVFISSDKDENQFQKYFEEMPWHAIPFSDRERKVSLCTKSSFISNVDAKTLLQNHTFSPLTPVN